MVKRGKIVQIVLILLASVTIFSQQDEYEVKAHFLGQFTKFITWPVDTLATEGNEKFVIGIYGNDPFEGGLWTIYADTKIQGREVKLQHIDELYEITECDLLFIPKISKGKLSNILAVTANRPILTVGDTPGYAERGVLINFYVDGNRTHFEINHSAIQKTGLSFNYKLLSLARIIHTGDK